MTRQEAYGHCQQTIRRHWAKLNLAGQRMLAKSLVALRSDAEWERTADELPPAFHCECDEAGALRWLEDFAAAALDGKPIGKRLLPAAVAHWLHARSREKAR